MSKFLESDTVTAFLASRGVDKDSPQARLEMFLPRKIVLQIWPSRIQGELGEDAMGGYVRCEFENIVPRVFSRFGAPIIPIPTTRERRAASLSKFAQRERASVSPRTAPPAAPPRRESERVSHRRGPRRRRRRRGGLLSPRRRSRSILRTKTARSRAPSIRLASSS